MLKFWQFKYPNNFSGNTSAQKFLSENWTLEVLWDSKREGPWTRKQAGKKRQQFSHIIMHPHDPFHASKDRETPHAIETL